MAYFDSPKNRALWEKELAVLRRKREQAAKQSVEMEPQHYPKESIRKETGRIPITFEQLLQDIHKYNTKPDLVKKENKKILKGKSL